MSEQTHCVLCGFALDAFPRHYAEGDFCADVAGCRRRALHLLERYREHVDDLSAALEAAHAAGDGPARPRTTKSRIAAALHLLASRSRS